MKYWRGYLTAAIFAAFTWGLKELAQNYQTLVDMVYPYVTKTLQGILAGWTSTADFCVWQTLVMLFAVGVLVSLVLVILFKGSKVQWLGWVLAVVSIVYCFHTVIYGLNYYAGPIAEDLRMETDWYTTGDLEDAAAFYRDKANELASQVNRDAEGNVEFSDFATLAEQTGNGFRRLTQERSFSVLGGDYYPVKELGWSQMYTSMGITGFTCFLTGEAAVNPMIPDVCLPFTMAHEMAHRISVAQEDEANFVAFLTASVNESVEYQYSAYFMAYRYCYNALRTANETAAVLVRTGCSELLLRDLNAYSQFFSDNKDETAARISDTVNDAYLKSSGDADGIASYGQVTDLLVNWYIQEYTEPEEELITFDPYDEEQVDLHGTTPTEETESGE